ncbi:MAG: beta-ketoacyl-ACP synthase [Acetobacteraceae bacterium]|nr:beta-ketoacyl-ACP synthase [Acetobacteraceae bacterium]
MTRLVAITGIGLVSSHGEGREAHLGLLAGAAPVLDEARFAPHAVHPLPPLAMEAAIPRREWRQMETWQRLGTYAAGLAIADAGAKERVADMDLVVAAGGGERDLALDEAIMAADPPERERHRMLGDGLRPTLFLAQLSNLLAGSISIVHGVGGSSRTLLGEEIAGAEALRIAAARVAAGTSRIALAGAAFVAERADMLLLYASGGVLHRGPWQPLPARRGLCLGSAAAFLVLEPEEEARARGAAPIARITSLATDQGDAAGRLARLAALAGDAPAALRLSAASGAVPGEAEAGGLFTADLIGHPVEAAFPAALALAALGVAAGAPDALVTGCGQWAGEAAARLERPA